MEQGESQLYTKEIDEARELNEKLGMGIGVFQVRYWLYPNIECRALHYRLISGVPIKFVRCIFIGRGELVSKRNCIDHAILWRVFIGQSKSNPRRSNVISGRHSNHSTISRTNVFAFWPNN